MFRLIFEILGILILIAFVGLFVWQVLRGRPHFWTKKMKDTLRFKSKFLGVLLSECVIDKISKTYSFEDAVYDIFHMDPKFLENVAKFEKEC